jgi:hypothetical protein
MKLNKEKLRAAIMRLPEWSATTMLHPDDSWTFNAFEAFGVWIVFDDFQAAHENERVFHIWDGKKLRETTEFEDDILRTYDDNSPLNERDDGEFIVSKESRLTQARD